MAQRRWVWAGVASALLVLAAGPAQAREPRLLSSYAWTAPMSSTWLPYWDFDAAYRSVLSSPEAFSTVSPFWYGAAACDRISGHPGAGAQPAIDGLRAQGLAVVPTITSALGPQDSIACFSDPGARAVHVGQVMAIATSRDYSGIELNYENLALTTDPGEAARVRDAFTALVTDVCAALHDWGKTCVVTVMPRTDDSSSVWRSKLIPAVYDYAALGAVADQVRVMAYDDHAPNTGPGPIAGYPWVRAIAEYTRTKVPAHKVELGIPLYGRDWSSSGVRTVDGSTAGPLAARHGATVLWDDEQHAPYFRYTAGGVAHEVWFSDARSVGDRLHLARAYGFRAAYWAAGQEDSQTWRVVREGSQAEFRDVSGNPHAPAIYRIASAGIAGGYPDGTFRPNAPVTRGQMATFLAKALQLPAAATAAPYTDVGQTVHAPAIAAVTEAGVAAGYGDGTFAPEAVVTRAQMATFLARALQLEPATGTPFSDVAGHVHEDSILRVAAAGITSGYPDGTFRPAQAVTRGQLASFLTRALGL